MLAIRWAIVWLYVIAGVLHLLLPAPFLTITPKWVPWPAHVIFITGLCEIVGAIGLLIPEFRKFAGCALAFYAVAVFPANINHALQDLGGTQQGLGLWYHLPRLVFQPILIWAALFAGELIHCQSLRQTGKCAVCAERRVFFWFIEIFFPPIRVMKKDVPQDPTYLQC